MAVYMIDTDISSYIMKRSDAAVLRKLAGIPVADVSVSAITKSELIYGVEISQQRQRNQAALDAYLRHVQVLDFPSEAAAHYAQIRAALKRRGTMIGANDLFIAAHARSLGLTLVTNNTREFRRVHGLAIENWTHSAS
jgi:tRNA(fMet)-specific endonuclease VapC